MWLTKYIKKFLRPDFENGNGCEYCNYNGYIHVSEFEGICEIPCPECRKRIYYD